MEKRRKRQQKYFWRKNNMMDQLQKGRANGKRMKHFTTAF